VEIGYTSFSLLREGLRIVASEHEWKTNNYAPDGLRIDRDRPAPARCGEERGSPHSWKLTNHGDFTTKDQTLACFIPERMKKYRARAAMAGEPINSNFAGGMPGGIVATRLMPVCICALGYLRAASMTRSQFCLTIPDVA
jgi:hypothetical protein